MERVKTQGEDSYVAWCRYIYDESGGIQSIVTCDSDAKGAFKVYASPSDTEQLVRLQKLVSQMVVELQGIRQWLIMPSSDDVERTAWPERVASIDTLLRAALQVKD